MDTISAENTILPTMEDKTRDITILDSSKNITYKNDSCGISVSFPITLSEIAYYGIMMVFMIIIIFTIICAMNGNHESIIKLVDYIIGRVMSITSGKSSYTMILK